MLTLVFAKKMKWDETNTLKSVSLVLFHGLNLFCLPYLIDMSILKIVDRVRLRVTLQNEKWSSESCVLIVLTNNFMLNLFLIKIMKKITMVDFLCDPYLMSNLSFLSLSLLNVKDKEEDQSLDLMHDVKVQKKQEKGD